MRLKKNILLLLILSHYISFAQEFQNNNILTEDVNFFPASPTISSLMKFEEIPVNAYNGIPDIQIPLFNTTLNNKSSYSLSLGYHPYSIALDEIAPYTGLGWNLFGGGTISRTVRGLPDEILLRSSQYKEKIGIYYDFIEQYNQNNYYDIESMINMEVSSLDIGYKDEKFKWETFHNSKYDTQHDLYQYNFMGYTGRFIIKKVENTNNLEIVRLDSNKDLKITLDYDFDSSSFRNLFSINGFTIITPNGMKYIFDQKETTIQSNAFESIYINDEIFNFIGPGITYPSAFQLSSVKDIGNQEIISISYEQVSENYSKAISNLNIEIGTNMYDVITSTGGDPNGYKRVEPKTHLSITGYSITTLKPSEIQLIGKAKIYFNLGEGRLDNNITVASQNTYLDEIEVKDWNNDLIYKYSFIYDYFITPYQTTNGHLQRMVLKEIEKFNSDLTESQTTQLFYKEVDMDGETTKDPWGFLSEKPINYSNSFLKSTVGVLEKIIYPSKGYTKFIFEPNTYSYIGNQAITDFEENSDNIVYSGTTNYSLVSDVSSQCVNFNVVTIPNYEDHSYIIDVNYINFDTENETARIYIESDDDDENLQLTVSLNNNGRSYTLIPDPNSQYQICLQNLSVDNPSSIDVDVKYFYKNSPQKEFLYGGGIRVKKIQHFDDIDSFNFIKEKEFDYDFFDTEKSSGALVYATPVFERNYSRKVAIRVPAFWDPPLYTEFDVHYKSITSRNNLSSIRTHGADVGYKNISISYNSNEDQPTLSSNGHTELTYYSPIDFPEAYSSYHLNYPYLPTTNIDFKRGLLEKEEVFGNDNNVLKLSENVYEFSNESEILTGVNVASQQGCAFAFLNNDFDTYKWRFENCIDNSTNVECSYMCGFPASHIQIHPLYEAKGKANLVSSTVNEFFYDNESITQQITINNSWEYNSLNQVTSELKATSMETPFKVEYHYPPDLIGEPLMQELTDANRIANPIIIKKTKVINGIEEKLSEQKTEYVQNATTSNLLLPKFVFSKKGEGQIDTTEDPILTYDRYDSKGNILQYTLENGIPVSIIWGYYGKYPIAKIEGVAYDQIEAIANNLAIASENDDDTCFTGCNEATFRTTLNNLRTISSLNQTMITTYTYDPLIGVTSITPPNGQTAYYQYDGFGRLKSVIDEAGNKLQDIQYHYRPTQ